MRLLIIGKTGQLGGELTKDAIAGKHDVFAPSREELDILDESAFLKAVKTYKPDAVINTAAFHNVPLCETEPLKAFQTNCLAVGKMAKTASQSNSLFISFSTDYVFGGEKREPYIESDRPNPLQIYGLSKLAGEYAALSYPKSIIIRTCGLYGAHGAGSKGGNFVDKRIADYMQGKPVEIGNDQTVSPTSASDLSKALLQLITHPAKHAGIYHMVNEGSCTWHEFTKAIYTLGGIDTEVIPVDRHGMSGNMRRPLYSALANTRAKALGIFMPAWRDALARYLKERYGANIQKARSASTANGRK